MRLAACIFLAALCLPGQPVDPRTGRAEGKLRAGDEAPTFTLKRQGQETKVSLSSFRGKRPVALVFGSFT